MGLLSRKVNDDAQLVKLFAEVFNNLGHAQVVYGAKDLIFRSASFKRPGNTTPYDAFDAVGPVVPAIMVFENVVATPGATGTIYGGSFRKTNTSVTNAQFRLWLFNERPTPVADNAQWAQLSVNDERRVGFIDFIFTANDGGGTGSDEIIKYNTNFSLDFQCASNDTNLYGVPTALAAYTPAALEEIKARLHIGRN